MADLLFYTLFYSLLFPSFLFFPLSKYLRPLEDWVARLQEEKNASETRFPTLPTLFKPILHIVLLVGGEE